MFGPKQKRKRVKLNNLSLEEMVDEVENKDKTYDTKKDTNLTKHEVLPTALIN